MVWGLSSSGRAPALQAGGGGFESRRLHHNQTAKDAKMRERGAGTSTSLSDLISGVFGVKLMMVLI